MMHTRLYYILYATTVRVREVYNMSVDPVDRRCEESFVEECRETFHRVGLKTSYARLVIAQFLVETSGVVTIGDVMKGVSDVQLDRGTVTRVLEAFSRVGFVAIRNRRGRELQFEVQSPLLRHEGR
jgi:Fe2+ or Zn2+ uptake regulation protein